MKKLLFFLCSFFLLQYINAQSVGVGTSTPNASAQLEVASTTKGFLVPRMTTAQRTAIAAPANGLMLYDTNLSAFYFYNGSSWNAVNSGGGGGSSWTASGNNIYNSNTGNVGIGSIVGLKEKLSVKGNLFVTHINGNDLVNGGNKAALNLHGANTGSGVVNFLKPDTSTGASIIYGNVLSQFFLQNGSNTYQLFLRSNGNVGVGTSSPIEKFDVNGNIRSRNNILADNDITLTGNLQAGNNVSASGNVSGGNLSTSGNLVTVGTSLLNGDVTTNNDININNAAAIVQFKINAAKKAFFQLNGDDLRFGTNSSNSAGKVVVRMDGDDIVSFEKSAAGAPLARFLLNGTSKGSIGLNAGGDMILGTGAGSAMVLTPTGGGSLLLNPTNAGNVILSPSGGGDIFMNTTSGGNIYMNPNGQVAIGVSVAAASGYKLTVSGKVLCEELKVKLRSSGWPDYVFGKDYNLPSLMEVEKFIQQYKHLPNIPTAAEVEENGIEVGDMQKRMMEKIEQLTLYVIELKKEINALKKEK